MIPETQLYLASGVLYAVVFVVLGAWLTRIDREAWTVCGLVAGIVGVAAVAFLLSAFGIGTVPLGEGEVDVPSFLEDIVAYGGFYAVAGILAGVSRKFVALLLSIGVIQRVAFELPNTGVVEGGAALAAAGIVVVGWFVAAYLFLGPVWRTAQNRSPGRRLLHWKCRNLLLFLLGVLILFAMAILADAVDEFVSSFVTVYIDLFIRIGLAGFIFVNAGSLVETGGEVLDGPEPGAIS